MMTFATPLRTARRGLRLSIGLLALLLVTVGCDSEDLGDANPQTPSVNDYVSEVSALSTLDGAVQEAGLEGALEQEGITLFAPLDGAFEPAIDTTLNQEVLRKVLQHHVVGSEVTSDQLSDGQLVTPLAGADLTIGVGEAVTVNRATVTNPDANAANGVVHVIDGLLADAVDRATLTPRFTIFARLVKEADLASALRVSGDNDGRTIFAPTNEALLAVLDEDDSGEVESDEIPANADEILQYHVLDSVFLAADVPESETAVQTLEGSDVTVVRSGDEVTVNPNDEGASVTTPNVEVDNGVIHGIDTVLMP